LKKKEEKTRREKAGQTEKNKQNECPSQSCPTFEWKLFIYLCGLLFTLSL